MEQERLRGLVVQALQDLVAYHLEAGAYEAALLHARRLLELDPLLEVAHRGVMLALAYSGQRSTALAQYETCRAILQEELGVEPEAETVTLYQRILTGEVAAPSEATGTPPHNLPVQLTPFVGRKAELTETGNLLSDPDVRLLTILAPGGMGKTRLALEVAAAQLDQFERGVFFVPLAPIRSAEGIVPTVADALGFSFYEGGEPRQQLLDYLRGKNMLLVIDNYEHLLEGAGLVSGPLDCAEGGGGRETVVVIIPVDSVRPEMVYARNLEGIVVEAKRAEGHIATATNLTELDDVAIGIGVNDVGGIAHQLTIVPDGHPIVYVVTHSDLLPAIQ